MFNGLETWGYYTFENGNTISNYVYTKDVDAQTRYGYNLTAECQDKEDPVLYPGWRAQYDNWADVSSAAGFSITFKTYNFAIKGLFKHIEDTEAARLTTAEDQGDEGFTQVDWSKTFVGYKEESWTTCSKTTIMNRLSLFGRVCKQAKNSRGTCPLSGGFFVSCSEKIAFAV